MSADTTGIILQTGGVRAEWRAAVVQNAESLFDYEPSATQVEAGRAYVSALYRGTFGPTSDETARIMAAKATHVACAESGVAEAPGKLNRAFLELYFRIAPVFESADAARAYLEEEAIYLEYGIVEYRTPEQFPADLHT